MINDKGKCILKFSAGGPPNPLVMPVLYAQHYLVKEVLEFRSQWDGLIPQFYLLGK